MGKASTITRTASVLPPVISIRLRRSARRAASRCAAIFSRALCCLILLVFVIVKVSQGSPSSPGSSSSNGTLLPASVASQVTGVPAATLDRVGKGSVPAFTRGQPAFTAGSGAAVTSGGKPEMLYIGAEFCPYCAAMRWSMAIALSRFGTLTPLHGIHSSPTDANPNTATLTFYKTGYHSNYLSFTPVEVQTVSRAPLQNPTS